MQELSHRQTNASVDYSNDQEKGTKKLQPDLDKQSPDNENQRQSVDSSSTNASGPMKVERGQKSMFQRCCPCLTIEFFQVYFDVTTADIKHRLLSSLIPFNKRFITMYKDKPDLYGPFWIYTTLIIMIAISGNISRYMEMGVDKFTYNFNYIPIAATIIYSLAVGLPFLLKLMMRFMGQNFFSGTFIEIIGIYGYSFTSFLITTILCAIPIQGLQWGLIAYSAFTSTGFLMVTFWNDLKEHLEPKKRLIVIGFICGVQIMFLLIFKMYFFKNSSNERVEENKSTAQQDVAPKRARPKTEEQLIRDDIREALREEVSSLDSQNEEEDEEDNEDEQENSAEEGSSKKGKTDEDDDEIYGFIKSGIIYLTFITLTICLIWRYQLMYLLMYSFMLLFTITNFIYHFVSERKKKQWKTIRDYTVKLAFIYVNVVYLLDLYKNQFTNQAAAKGKPGKQGGGGMAHEGSGFDQEEELLHEIERQEKQTTQFNYTKWMREYVCLILLFAAISLKDRFFKPKPKTRVERMMEREEELERKQKEKEKKSKSQGAQVKNDKKSKQKKE